MQKTPKSLNKDKIKIGDFPLFQISVWLGMIV